MPVYRLPRRIAFPDPREANADGLLAVGGDLSPQRVLTAYALGIFPWPHDQTLLWFSPDPRLVLEPAALHVSQSLQKTLRKGIFEVRFDTAFGDVIQACARIKRPQQRGTWITAGMITAYSALHEMGLAHSAEAWCEGKLVGGVYGIALGAAFFGESMFTYQNDASKIAFVHLVRQLQAWGFLMLDCQVYSDHLARFGAVQWHREQFLQVLARALQVPTRRGSWAGAGMGRNPVPD